MTNKQRLIQYLYPVLLLIFHSGGNAHEFWLEPLDFTLQEQQTLQAHLKVGENFKGETLPYLNVDINNFTISRGQQTQVVNSRFGSIRAVNQDPVGTGLNIISYTSNYSKVIYPSTELFTDFLDKSGLNWVLEEHKKRGLPASGFTEVYRRFCKSLVMVGENTGRDRPLGLEFEWLLESKPYPLYQQYEQPIQARLLWRQKPFSNAKAAVFTRKDSHVTQLTLITDSEGRIAIPRNNGGVFLVSAVHMIKPSEQTATETGAVWESVWASIIFEVP